ncbi:hypothetical protein BLOT_004383 [Blomia tropicalis]|nr:hypothetical protein BLOT_004383 [Blomia tropicalis]
MMSHVSVVDYYIGTNYRDSCWSLPKHFLSTINEGKMCLCFTQSLTNGSNVIVKIVNSRYTNNNDKKALKRVCDI